MPTDTHAHDESTERTVGRAARLRRRADGEDGGLRARRPRRIDEDDNLIRGTDEDDDIVGTDGNDLIYAKAGNDQVSAGAGDDKVRGGDGEDQIFGEAGDDKLGGGAGNDRINGGEGNDKVFGGQGDDAVFGDDGDDVVFGGQGDDIVSGGDGNDTVRGGKGNDEVDGGSGDDKIVGGPGDDTLTGGDGADEFIFNLRTSSAQAERATGDNVITDFSREDGDTIQIKGEDFETSFTYGDSDGDGIDDFTLITLTSVATEEDEEVVELGTVTIENAILTVDDLV